MRKLEILEAIVSEIDKDKYYEFTVERKKAGFFLVPDEPRYLGDEGEFMGKTFEDAKVAIIKFVRDLN